jgi:hypothetical protein
MWLLPKGRGSDALSYIPTHPFAASKHADFCAQQFLLTVEIRPPGR